MNANYEELIQGIITYIRQDQTGALMVTGSWGCGKSYFFKNILFKRIKEELHLDAIIVSLFGIKEITEIPQRILSASLDANDAKISFGKYVDFGKRLIEGLGNIDISKILGTGDYLLKAVSKETVICIDDVERAIDVIDINEILGVINNLVENLNYKVIVIANKEYIDHSKSKDTTPIEVFYEKVIEKSLSFQPDIISIFRTIVDEFKDASFAEFMTREAVLNSINPRNARNKEITKKLENIRTLKFAIKHFYTIYHSIYESVGSIDDSCFNALFNIWVFTHAISIEFKSNKLTLEDCRGLDSLTQVVSLDLDLGLGIEDEVSNQLCTEDSSIINEKPRLDSIIDDYYTHNTTPYIFYRSLYKFILGGIQCDPLELIEFARSEFARLSPSHNAAQESLNNFLNNWWSFSDEEVREELKTIINNVREGKLSGFVSYYNASVFLFNLREIIDLDEETVFSSFAEGIPKYADKVEGSSIELTSINFIDSPLDHPCNRVKSILLENIKRRISEQEFESISELKKQFKEDISEFSKSFLPEQLGCSAGKYFNDPVLHHIDEELIKEKVLNFCPKDAMWFYRIIQFRYIDHCDRVLIDEIPFLSVITEEMKVFAQNNPNTATTYILQKFTIPAIAKAVERLHRIKASTYSNPI